MMPVIYSPQFLQHKTGRFHPERPERLTAIVEALQKAPWAAQIQWQEPTSIEGRSGMELLSQIHGRHYIGTVRQIAEKGGGQLDADTVVSAQSYEIALLAVSAWLDGVDQVLTRNNPAFVLARPPGHHAEGDRGMGFCLFSNAAIAAHYALTQPGVDRVAILDWDVHHGNGTQEIVEQNPQIVYCSLHQSPCYPGTGAASEKGFHNNVLNFPLKPGSDIQDYRSIFEHRIVPFFQDIQPDLLIVSAGYDANADDPLASLHLHPPDYGILTDYCLQVTRRILFGLEGGYDLSALAQSVVETIGHCL